MEGCVVRELMVLGSWLFGARSSLGYRFKTTSSALPPPKGGVSAVILHENLPKKSQNEAYPDQRRRPSQFSGDRPSFFQVCWQIRGAGSSTCEL